MIHFSKIKTGDKYLIKTSLPWADTKDYKQAVVEIFKIDVYGPECRLHWQWFHNGEIVTRGAIHSNAKGYVDLEVVT